MTQRSSGGERRKAARRSASPGVGDVDEIRRALRELADPERARNLARYFQTGPGGYGEGDRFLGIRVPAVRRVAKRHAGVPLGELTALLRSEYHEERLLALLMLAARYAEGDRPTQKRVFDLYIEHLPWINNWDLVDVSAPRIVGEHLQGRDRSLLYELAASENVWRRRVAILATAAFIREGDFDDTLALATRLLADPEDLIHKAVGWMLREVGKRDPAVAEAFVERHHALMPRTMLRYAIERFPESKRRRYVASRKGGRGGKRS